MIDLNGSSLLSANREFITMLINSLQFYVLAVLITSGTLKSFQLRYEYIKYSWQATHTSHCPNWENLAKSQNSLSWTISLLILKTY